MPNDPCYRGRVPTFGGPRRYTLPAATRSHRHGKTFYVHNWKGQPVARAWPKKRGKKATPAQKAARAAFAKMVFAQKTALPVDQLIARVMSQGSVYAPRDILALAMTGQLWVFGPPVPMTIQTELDSITNIVGSLLVRGPGGWSAVLPGTTGDVLTTQGVGQPPIYKTPLTPANTTGLWGPLLPTTPPTKVSTGLVNTLGSPVPTVSDTTAGVHLLTNAAGGAAYTTTVPATPYTLHVLMTTITGITGVGWTDGTKLEFIYQAPFGSPDGRLIVQSNSNISTFAATQSARQLGSCGFSPFIWYGLTDDGTNIIYTLSLDGVNYREFFRHTKAAGFLGATGYRHLLIGCPGGGAGEDVSLMAWTF